MSEKPNIGFSFGDNTFYIHAPDGAKDRVATHREIYLYLLCERSQSVSRFLEEVTEIYNKKYGEN